MGTIERSSPGALWLPNTDPSPVASGRPGEHRVDVWDIAHTIAAGNRLRIHVASADTPNHEPLAEPALQAVLHDPYYPSELVLTVRTGRPGPPRPVPAVR